MAEQTVDILIKLKDEITAELNKVNMSLNAMEQNASKSQVAWTKFASQLYVAKTAFNILVGAIKPMINAAMESEDALKRMNFAMELQGTFTESLSQKYINLAKTMEQTTRFSDEAIMRSVDTLITIGNIAPQNMQRVIQASADFATKMGMDIESSAQLIARAAQGNAMAFNRLGADIDSTARKSEVLEKALGFIETKMGGSAQRDINSFAGQMAMLGKTWDNLLKEMGMFITQSDTTAEAISKVNTMLLKMIDYVKEAKTAFSEAKEVMKSQEYQQDVSNYFYSLFPNLAEKYFGYTQEEFNKLYTQGYMDVALPGIVTKEEPIEEKIFIEKDANQEIFDDWFQKENQKIQVMRDMWTLWNDEKYSMQVAAMQKESEKLTFLIENEVMAHRSLWTIAGNLRDQFSLGVSNMFMNMIEGTFKAKQAFEELGKSMIKVLIDFAAQAAVSGLLSLIFGLGTAGIGGVAAGKASGGFFGKIGKLFGMAEGGIVTRPTVALIGEAGPEAVVPLNKPSAMGGVTVNIQNASFRSQEDIENVFYQISNLMNEKQRG